MKEGEKENNDRVVIVSKITEDNLSPRTPSTMMKVPKANESLATKILNNKMRRVVPQDNSKKNHSQITSNILKNSASTNILKKNLNS